MGAVFVKQRAIPPGHQTKPSTHAANHDVAQRHRLPRDRTNALCAEYSLRDILICGTCPPPIDRLQHLNKMVSTLGCEPNVWRRSVMNESIAETEKRVDAIMKKRVDGGKDRYSAARRLTVKS